MVRGEQRRGEMPRIGFSQERKAREILTASGSTATARQPQAGSQTWSGTISQEAIARAAYELYERRGRIDGFDQQDWFEAERIVRQRGQRAGNGR